jgi:hypothetical protein
MSNCDFVAARSLIDQIDQRSGYRAVDTLCRPL